MLDDNSCISLQFLEEQEQVQESYNLFLGIQQKSYGNSCRVRLWSILDKMYGSEQPSPASFVIGKHNSRESC